MTDPYDGIADPEGTSGRRIVVIFVAVALSLAVYLVVKMPGMSHSGSATARSASMTSDMALSVEDFAAGMADPKTFVVNVHTSADAEIPGTDVTIAYDVITSDDRLPEDHATPIALYCKTGRMSKAAAEALMNDGYRDVVYLDGGTDAWVAAGKTLS